MSIALDPSTVRGVTIHVDCDYCAGKRRLPGGRYKSEGEVINCPVCNGRGTMPRVVTLSMFYDLLHGNLTKDPTSHE